MCRDIGPSFNESWYLDLLN
jgi:hypothetical protein